MPTITRAQLLAFMRQEPYAVQASVSSSGAPQAAIVGVIVSEQFEVFFDTLGASRKAQNLRSNASAAIVIGPLAAGSARTVQLEGVVDQPRGAELERLLALYFASFPDGRQRQAWPGMSYFRVRPAWLRYSDFSVDPPAVAEFSAADLHSP